jgi:hypothetical protein
MDTTPKTQVVGYVRAVRVDGLCDRCWLPSLISFTLIILLDDGISEHDRGTRCAHCDRRDR